MLRRYWVILLVVLTGCGLNVTRTIVPVPDQDSVFLPQSKGIAATKDDISVVVVPLPDVKEADAFGVLIANESSHWISFNKKDFVLVQSGKVRHPMSDAQINAAMGTYKPKMPSQLNADIFDWRRSINLASPRGSRVIDKDKTISVIRGAKETVYVFFRASDDLSPMQLIIPNIINGDTGTRTRFSFKFIITKK